jgi:hypothetical protein
MKSLDQKHPDGPSARRRGWAFRGRASAHAGVPDAKQPSIGY